MPELVLRILARAGILGRMAKKVRDPSEAASALSKRGAKKGGIARANVLTAQERKEIAQAAVRARWAKAGKLKTLTQPIEGEYQETDSGRPIAQETPHSIMTGTLHLGDAELECHVLSDLRRVFTQGQVVRALTGGTDTSDLQRYLRRNPLFDGHILAGPIPFKIPGIPTEGKGLDAEQFIEICDLYIEAYEQGKLRPSQHPMAKRAQAFVRASAKVGIIALIDEVTGYQKVRAKRALELKLQAFIADEMQEWAVMFPEEFWFELARLEGIRYSPRNRPLRWGKYVMAFVYDAIDEDVGRELRKKNPNPHFLQNHHQWLQKFGRDKVRDQILQDVVLMKSCDTIEEFKAKFARVFKKAKLGSNGQLAFDDLWA